MFGSKGNPPICHNSRNHCICIPHYCICNARNQGCRHAGRRSPDLQTRDNNHNPMPSTPRRLRNPLCASDPCTSQSPFRPYIVMPCGDLHSSTPLVVVVMPVPIASNCPATNTTALACDTISSPHRATTGSHKRLFMPFKVADFLFHGKHGFISNGRVVSAHGSVFVFVCGIFPSMATIPFNVTFYGKRGNTLQTLDVFDVLDESFLRKKIAPPLS